MEPSWDDLPKYDSSQNEIEYTVTEESLDDFETIVEGNGKNGMLSQYSRLL